MNDVVIGTGETVAFWILGPVALAGALGMDFSRNAVHSALWLVNTMLALGVFYVIQEAPFLGAVQIIVYTGAIMILFLFVLMLVGRDSSDSLVEVLRGVEVLHNTYWVRFNHRHFTHAQAVANTLKLFDAARRRSSSTPARS